jgi:hypothetical protein
MNLINNFFIFRKKEKITKNNSKNKMINTQNKLII